MHKAKKENGKTGKRVSVKTGKGGATSPNHYERMTKALDLVAAERVRQRALIADGILLDDCSDPSTSHQTVVRVLGEEFGEVCRATNQLLDFDRRAPLSKDIGGRMKARLIALREEYVQAAAVAVARVEALNQLEGMMP